MASNTDKTGNIVDDSSSTGKNAQIGTGGDTDGASNTVEKRNTADDGNTIAKLQAELARLQAQLQAQATSAQVPPSVTSSSQAPLQPLNAQANFANRMSQDPELQALNLDWGDYDPNQLHSSLSEPSYKRAFLLRVTSQLQTLLDV